MGMFDEIKVPKSYLKGLLTKDQEKLLSGNNYQTKSFENFLAQYKIYRQKLYLKDAECSKEEKWVRASYSGKVNFYDSMADQDGNEWWAEFDFLFSRDSELQFGDYSLPVGFAVSGSHQERHNREVGTNEITWVPGGYGLTATNVTGTGRPDGVVFTPEIVGFKAKDNERLRQNFQATFQIQLTDKAVLTLDNTFSSLEFETRSFPTVRRNFESAPQSGG